MAAAACAVSLVEQASRAPCTSGETFGCQNLQDGLAIWVRNCRGLFRCRHGPILECGFPPGAPAAQVEGGGARQAQRRGARGRDVAAASRPLDLELIRQTFTRAVEKRLMSDVPFGVLLSGGLDSSLVASVIARLRRKRFLEHGDTADLEPLKSFSIGLEGSPDLVAAKKVAEAIGTEVNKGYIYFAMTFSLIVEMINIQLRRRGMYT